ncbi:MAG: DUF3782 domain-containing protein [Methanosarcinales archaeon]|nr:DUF3782 domain-containing protein [Methanosarcinales archaeon]
MTDATENSIITYEYVLKLFEETAKRFKETDKRIREADEKLDKRIKETDERFKETAERFKETDEKFKEVAEGFKETKQIVKETSRSVGSLSNTWGEFVEGLVAPAAVRLFREKGYAVNKIQKRVNALEDGKGIEVDILVVNGEFLILIEAKSTLRKKDVDNHLTRIADFRYFFPEHKDKKLIGAVAGIMMGEEIEEYAYSKGLFVIAQIGDSVKIINNNEFKASEW